MWIASNPINNPPKHMDMIVRLPLITNHLLVNICTTLSRSKAPIISRSARPRPLPLANISAMGGTAASPSVGF